MTIRIPKWLLGVTVVSVVAVAAFVLGRSSDDGGHKTAGASSEAPKAECSKRMAEKAVLASTFDDSVHAHERLLAELADADYPPVEPRFFSDTASDYQVALVRCRDLDGNGTNEMVVAVAAGASGRIASWGIFTPAANDAWRLEFERVGVPVGTLDLDGKTVLVKAPTYAKGDPLCCPSGFKATRVAFSEGSYHLVPAPSAGEREVVVSDGQVVVLGEFPPPVDSPVEAFADFGTPTEISGGDREACTLTWADLGLSIDFANFGGEEACGPEGRVAFIELFGDAAAHAGWRVGGARIEMPIDELRDLYPGARETASEIVLVETPSVIGADGTVAVLTAYITQGRVGAFRAYVGAAGE